MKNSLYLHEEEKNRILNLHKKLISEQTVDPNVKALTDAAATELTRLYPNNEFMNQTAKDINDKLAYETKEGDVNNPEQAAKRVMNNNLVPYIKQLIQTKSGDKIKFDNVSTVTPVNTTTQTGQQPNKIATLQGIINKNFGGNLVPDGKWGPKTAAAVQKALATKTATTNTATTNTATANTATANTATGTVAPEPSTQDLSKYGLKTVKQYMDDANPYTKGNTLKNQLGL